MAGLGLGRLAVKGWVLSLNLAVKKRRVPTGPSDEGAKDPERFASLRCQSSGRFGVWAAFFFSLARKKKGRLSGRERRVARAKVRARNPPIKTSRGESEL